MKKKKLVIFKDQLDSITPLLKEIVKNTLFEIEIVFYNDFFLKIDKHIKGLRFFELFFAVDSIFFDTISGELTGRLKKHFDHAFFNIVQIFLDERFIRQEQIVRGRYPAFYFTPAGNISLQVNFFTTFMIDQFSFVQSQKRLNDFIVASFKEALSYELLDKKTIEVKKLNDTLAMKNKTDSLTNLYNRRAIYEVLNSEQERVRRQKWNLDNDRDDSTGNPEGDKKGKAPHGKIRNYYGVFSIILIDIDNFKQINDKYGHLIGDVVLKNLGTLLLESNILRKNDIPGRYGGEEFVIILPETNVNSAATPAERIRKDFNDIVFYSRKKKPFHVSLSIGVSQYNPEDSDIESIIKRADTAMYKAKALGKNRVILYKNITAKKNDA